jgi:glycosyltransferase involved in cell wall biosynthesis
VLADAEVENDIRESLRAKAILPSSIWHRLGDGAGALTRYSRVFTHNWQTWRVMNEYLRRQPEFDAIFVPTVSVHHLLAWARLVKGTLRHRNTRVLLFFLTAPAKLDSAGRIVPDTSAGARLLLALIKWLAPEVRDGKVVLGVETKAIQKAFEHMTGLPFVWFPQPVGPSVRNAASSGEWIEMACFGGARAEKGSDVLQEAISLHCRKFPSSRARFTIQWVEDFNAGGRLVTKSSELQGAGKVRFVTRYFRNGEYAEHLRNTDVMLLPYRLSSYSLRGSRVVIEAAVNGIPVVTTRGTTLAGVAEEFGIGIWCEDGDSKSLAGAIAEMESNFEKMSRRAGEATAAAVELFSVREFRRIFAASAEGAPAAKLVAVAHPASQAPDGTPKFLHEP